MTLSTMFTVESNLTAVSLLESGEWRYIKAMKNNNNNMFLALSTELLVDPFAAERSGFNDTFS